jgi:hypothetical protein
MATKKSATNEDIKTMTDEVRTVPVQAPSENELIGLLPEFVEAFKAQLMSDQERWHDEWKKRPVTGQEFRNFNRFREYMGDFVQRAVPMPWLKVIGNAYIAWVRENHPELLEQ